VSRGKPEREFRVAFPSEDGMRMVRAVARGETFFVARAALAVRLHIEPLAIRLDPPRRFA
jgi:hypothetical protein